MVKPFWLKALLHDFADFFGIVTGGSPKADEWCIFFTVYLFIALVSL